MPWTDELLAARSQAIVEALLALLEAPQRWRHRRVETLTPLSASFVRRRVSIDFTVPAELHAGLRLEAGRAPSEHDQWLVPLGWLARRQLVNFDLRDRAGEALPLLLGAQTAELTRDLLLLAAVGAGLDRGDRALTQRTLDVVVDATRPDRPRPDELVARAGSLGLEAQFVSLVRASASGFLLLAVVSQVAGRQVVKLQSDERRRTTDFAPFSLDLQVPGLNEAASTHVELELPDVLQATRFELWDELREEGQPPGAGERRLAVGEREPSPSEERPRLLLRPVASARDPHVRAELVVSPAEFLVPATALTVLALAILVAGLWSGVADLATARRSTAATVLLAAFAALSGLVLRVEEQPLLRSVLLAPRMALGATALAMGVAAVPVSLQLARGAVLGGWWIGLALASGALLVLLWTLVAHTRAGQRYG